MTVVVALCMKTIFINDLPLTTKNYRQIHPISTISVITVNGGCYKAPSVGANSRIRKAVTTKTNHTPVRIVLSILNPRIKGSSNPPKKETNNL
jgi:hypothetical protein